MYIVDDAHHCAGPMPFPKPDLLDSAEPSTLRFHFELKVAATVASGEVHEIATHTGDLTISGGATYRARLSLAPDGKSLATSAVDRKSDLWLLEGYPR